MYTTEEAWLNNFVQLSWLSLIENYFPPNGEVIFSLNSRIVLEKYKVI